MNLTPADLANLASSGISAELAQQAQIRRVDSIEGGTLVGRNGKGDYAGLDFPYCWPGEKHIREHRLRRDHPDFEYKDGEQKEKAKYLSPPGRGNMVYFTPGTPAEWLQDATLPILITEGEKKCLAVWTLAHHGVSDAAERPWWLAMGLPGVWNWRGTIGKTTGPDGDRRDVKGVITDIERVTWRRKVTIVFDVNVLTNESVQAARAMLTGELRKRGAEVSWFAWPEDTPQGVNGIDDLLGLWGADKTLQVLRDRSRPIKMTDAERKAAPREFSALADDHFSLKLPAFGVEFDIDRLRRERHELIGELAVRCEIPGARTVDGTLSIADFNLSSARARSERSKLLAERANTKDMDWSALVEELCQRVLQADRAGLPAVDLRQLPKPDRENDTIDVDGLTLPRKHPSILFGDGGAVKSYTGLFFGGRLAMRGMRVALFDWELVGDDHRDRLERLFGPQMPRILYARCERPLVFEVDRLRRIVREGEVDFTIFDSVAFACDGAPESAETAARYFRAVRQIGGGSLHVAHVNKGENSDQKPFGSVFWHNGARSTWFAQRADDSDDVIRLGLFNRKANLGRLSSPLGFTVSFTEDRTVFRRSDVADSPELAKKLTIGQRMRAVLKAGPLTVTQIADELEVEVNTITQTVNRYTKKGHNFIVLEGQNTNRKIGLLARDRVS